MTGERSTVEDTPRPPEVGIDGGGRTSGATPRRVSWAAAALCVVSPFVALVTVWRAGWRPVSDQSAVVAGAFDVFSSSPPLTGNTSALTDVAGSVTQIYHPGPIQLWLLAGPVHLFAPSPVGALIGSALLIAVCTAVILTVAYRIGGSAAFVVATVLVAGLGHGVETMHLTVPIQPFLCTYALAATIFCAWAGLEGRDHYWPAVMFFASLSMQPEVAYLIPAGAVVAVALAARTVRWWGGRGAPDRVAPDRRRIRRIVVASIVVLVACWSGPLHDQFFGSGNLWNLAGAGTGSAHMGPLGAMQPLVSMVAAPAWVWDHSYFYGYGILEGARGVSWRPAPWQIVCTVFVAAVFVAGMWRAVATRNRPRTTFGVLCLGALAGQLVSTALLPSGLDGVGHLYTWQAAAMAVWFFVGLTLVDELRKVIDRPRRRPWAARGAATVALLAACGLVVSAAVTSRPPDTYASAYFDEIDRFTRAAAPLCRADGPVLVVPEDTAYGSTAQGLISMLLLEGCDIHIDGIQRVFPGSHHTPDGDEPVVLVVSTSPEVPDGFRRLAEPESPAATRHLLVRGPGG